MKKRAFPYAPWFKGLGLVLILIGITSFIYRYNKNGVFDYNELAIGLCFGLLFIFLSKEKVDDEMIHHLKFKALTKAVFVSFFLMHLYNYFFLNWRFNRENGMILSISAYQFLAITLILATCIFYFEKKQIEVKGEE